MNKTIADRLFATLLLVLVLAFLLTASRMNSVAGRMPLIVGSFTLILLVAYFVGEFWPGKASAQPKQKKPELEEDDEDFGDRKDALNWYDIRVWGWMLVLFACVFFGGIAIGIGVLTVLFFRYAAKGTWRAGLVFGLLQGAFMFFVFEVAFQTVLYRGWIFETIFERFFGG